MIWTENRKRSEAESRFLSGLKFENACPEAIGRNWFAAISKSLWVFLFCLFSYILFLTSKANAQSVTATLKADSNHIVIGDFLNLKLTVKSPEEFIVKMPIVVDTIGNMELVKASKIDTSINGNFRIFSQTYTVSAYDSGKYHAGPEKIYFKSKSGVIDSILSDSVVVTVSTVAVDTSKAIKAIKPPIDVPYTLKEFLPYIIGGWIVLVIIVIAIYFLLIRRKRKSIPVERPRPKDPAHVWARKELSKLEEERLWQKDEIKLYYSRLTDILRMYLEYRYNWFALESTTEEIEDNISSYINSDEAKANLMMTLRNADLVKFAKMLPAPDVNSKMMESAFKFIDLTESKVAMAEDKVNV